MTVRQFLDNPKILTELNWISDKNEYWKNSFHFVRDNYEKDIETMTPAQRDWLEKIRTEIKQKKGIV